MGVLRIIVITLTTIFIGQQALHLMRLLGFNKPIYYHAPGPCRLVDDINEGSEDIQIVSNGIAIITSGLRFETGFKDPVIAKRQGVLYTFDFNEPEAGAQKLPIEGPTVYNPHGLGIWEDPATGDVIVFVVNHEKDGDQVEKFQFDKEKGILRHMKTIKDPAFQLLNDITPTGPDSFYLGNYRGASSSLGRHIEALLMLPWGSVLYYNGKTAQQVVTGLRAPNGINLSPDGRFVYVANIGAETLNIYSRKEDNSLELKEEVFLHSFIDNLDVSKDTGDIWIGAHPVGWKVVAYLENHKAQAPSQVLRLKIKDGHHVTKIEEIYSEEGETISGSTVAVYYPPTEAMLIGTVHHKLLYCDVHYMT